MPFRACLFAAAVPTALGWAAPARATPDFPAVIQQVVGSAAPPPCTICHNNPNGGLGTVTTVFGLYMRSRGLVPYDENSLRNALAAASAEQHVSNAEGIADVQALREGLDPNVGLGAAPTQSQLPPPDYGCGARVAPGRGESASTRLLLAAGIAIVRRRRSMRRRSCRYKLAWPRLDQSIRLPSPAAGWGIPTASRSEHPHSLSADRRNSRCPDDPKMETKREGLCNHDLDAADNVCTLFTQSANVFFGKHCAGVFVGMPPLHPGGTLQK
jgi:hypothetical protein